MQISLKWLNQYVDVKEYFSKPEDLGHLLTTAGLEVENFQNFAERFKNVVVAKIEKLEKHPDADKLTVCQVDCGEENLRQIICGAKNHKQGDKVVAALPGAILPGEFKIKDSKIRGVESKGMLCSEVELGISEDSAGIMILPEEAKVGVNFADHQGLDDVVFELSVTPNRADCLSHIGLAREVACLLGRELKLPEIKLSETGAPTGEMMKLKVNNTDFCPRYAGRAIRGVKVGPSPTWLKTTLESVGLNSINNIVDITNYVMLEYGQPLHAFDASFIKGSEIIVDNAKSGEKFTTLDGTELKLEGDELTIRDAEKPVALAGIVGGLNSGVVDSTTDVFLEAAYFTQKTVRKTSRKFGIDTDSGYRFSRGTDPENVINAMNRACQLMQDLAGGEVAKDYLDEYPQPLQKEVIHIGKTQIEERLGYAINMDEFSDWMQRLGCEVEEAATADEVNVKAPNFRWDLFYDVDLIEEFARLNGYDKIPETLPHLVEEPTKHDEQYWCENFIATAMIDQGYNQAVHYNFLSEKEQEKFLGQKQNDIVAIQNPLSEEFGVMRSSLLPWLYKNLLHNYRHGQEQGRVFESGYVFKKNQGEIKESEYRYSQSLKLGAIAWGQGEDLWAKDSDRPVVYDLKAHIENMLTHDFKSSAWQWRDVKAESVPSYLHPGQCAELFYEGKSVGLLGSLHPLYKQEAKVRVDVALCEFDIESMMRGQPRKPKLKEISKFPAVQRDFAFLLPLDLKIEEVIKQISKVGGKLLQSVKVFDVYEGEKLEKGMRSVAFRLTFQDFEGTLDEKRLTQLQKDITEKVSAKLGIEIR